MSSCPKEIDTLWKLHIDFNHWSEKEETKVNTYEDRVYSPDEIPWL